MGLKQVPKNARNVSEESGISSAESIDWIAVTACTSLIASGILLLAGQRRAGMVLAASGTALALVDERDTLRKWWQHLPAYVDQVQWLVNQAQEVVDDVTAKGESLKRALSR